MASRYPSTQYDSSVFIVSAGSVLFRRGSRGIEICLIHYEERDEWLLPKGRKDVNESIEVTAIRETYEETGYKCRLLELPMITRQPFPGDLWTGTGSDAPRLVQDAKEPFMVTVRHYAEGNIKFIWWFISCLVDDNVQKEPGTQIGDEGFVSCFFPAAEALAKVTFDDDREIVRKAWEAVEKSAWAQQSQF